MKIDKYKCTNCFNEDRGEPNVWYTIVKFKGEDFDPNEPICDICNGESVWSVWSK